MRISPKPVLFAVVLGAYATSVQAQGRVVVSHDEWFTGSSFFNADEQQFVSNVLSWFGVGSGESLLIYSNNSFLTNASFQSWLIGQGIGVTVDAFAGSFAGFDAVFTSGNSNLSGTGAALASYVQAGGQVMAIGGTGVGGAAAEAAYNNVFLGAFGLQMLPLYNGVGTVNTSGFASQGPFGASLFTGVSSIYATNGNNTVSAAVVPNVSSQLFYTADNDGVFAAAVVRGDVVPEPAALLLLATGLLGVAVVARQRRPRTDGRERARSRERSDPIRA